MMHLSEHDGQPEVIKLLSTMCDVPEGQLRLSVDDASMSLAALLPHMAGFCADPVHNADGILNLGFDVKVKEGPTRIVHVAHDLDVARPLTTSDIAHPKTEMPASKKGSAAPKHAGPHQKKKYKPWVQAAVEVRCCMRPPWPSQLLWPLLPRCGHCMSGLPLGHSSAIAWLRSLHHIRPVQALYPSPVRRRLS
jgi:hypothetical protein